MLDLNVMVYHQSVFQKLQNIPIQGGTFFLTTPPWKNHIFPQSHKPAILIRVFRGMDKTQTNGGYPEMRIPKMDGLGIQNSNEIGCLLPNLHFPLFRNQQGPSFYQIHRIG